MLLKIIRLAIKGRKKSTVLQFSKKLGFTLIEILISVSVLAVLGTAVVYILNPSEIIVQNQDYIRVNDLKSLDQAIKLNKFAGFFLNYDDYKNKIYISLPDKNGDGFCSEYSLPSLVSGWSYHCAASSDDLGRTDGYGWIPIDFSNLKSQPINKLPIDPINTAVRDNYYTFNLGTSKNSYSLSAKLESEKYIIDVASLDGGNNNIVYEIRPISWTTVPTVVTGDSMGNVGSFGSIAIDPYDLPVVSYISNSGKDLKVLKCGSDDCASGNVTSLVDTAGNIGQDTAIVIGNDGFPVISYRNESTNELKVVKCTNAFCSPGNVIISVIDTSDNVGTYSSIAIGNDGYPIISYYDKSNRDLKVAKCGDAVCTPASVIKTTIDSANNVGEYTSIAIGVGDSGLPIISYYDDSNRDLKVVKCGNSACSAAGGYIITAVDGDSNVYSSTDKVGKYSSIAVSSFNLPIISYYDDSNHDLKVVKCGNSACSVAGGYTFTSVDTAGDVGEYTSIVIDKNGLPIISYYDDSNHDLKVAKCGNSACSSGNSINTADSAGRVGQYTSIAVSLSSYSDNLPVVSYYNASSKDLKIAKCNQSNNFCSNGN
jgi:prepilin-type N-terminal cleavage/methylation domain-containing protein